ncbi:hypothetical protein SPRG_12115, partial [Saprolegnia parasitica CBS 223.65]
MVGTARPSPYSDDRLSFVSSVHSSARHLLHDSFEPVKTPLDADLEGGALRDGGAPSITSPEILALLFQYACIGI